MKLHYFDQDTYDSDDLYLQLAIKQEYVPEKCLLGGRIVTEEIRSGNDPCSGCNGPREKCGGRPKHNG